MSRSLRRWLGGRRQVLSQLLVPETPMADTTLQDDLRDLPPGTFASKYIFEGIPHVFGGDLDAYVQWKSELGDQIEVDPRAIAITGSAGVGVSLNPFKGLKAFGPASDVDVAVVSGYHFEMAWRHMRSMSSANRMKLSQSQRESVRDHVSRLIYWGTIATDRILEIFPFAHGWVVGFNHMAGMAPTAGREINARIYRDFESLRAYQLRSVEMARSRVPPPSGGIA